jgi:hypothetical protein
MGISAKLSRLVKESLCRKETRAYGRKVNLLDRVGVSLRRTAMSRSARGDGTGTHMKVAEVKNSCMSRLL